MFPLLVKKSVGIITSLSLLVGTTVTNIRALVLLNLLSSLRKRDQMLSKSRKLFLFLNSPRDHPVVIGV